MTRLMTAAAGLALLGGAFSLWNARAMASEVERFAERPPEMSPDRFPIQFPHVTRVLEKQGLYPVWPKNISPADTKSLMSRAHRDLILRHRQLTVTGWSLLAVSLFALVLQGCGCSRTTSNPEGTSSC